MAKQRHPASGLSLGERRIFWRLLAACGNEHSRDIDVEDHCRQVARIVVTAQKRVERERQAYQARAAQ